MRPRADGARGVEEAPFGCCRFRHRSTSSYGPTCGPTRTIPARTPRKLRSQRDHASAPRPQARDEGISALYRGIGIRSAHSFSQAFVYFFTYNYLRRKVEASCVAACSSCPVSRPLRRTVCFVR